MRKINTRQAWFILGSVVFLVLNGCKKDPPPVTCDTPIDDPSENRCYSLDSLQDCGGLFHSEIEFAPAYKYPAINPNNANQFCYYLDRQVFKHDMGTGQSSLLADDVFVVGRMDWGAKGWITFSTIEWKVWRLKDDGSELTQITNTPRDLGPEFDPSGETILYSRTEFEGGNRLMLIDVEGNKLDSFCRPVEGTACYPWIYCSWSPDGAHFAAEHGPNNDLTLYGLGLYDSDMNLEQLLYEPESLFDGKNFIRDIEWHTDQQSIIFVDGFGIKEVDLNNDEISLLKEACDSWYYADVAVSPNGDFILAQRCEAEIAENGCDILQTWRIVKMDIDGGNEVVIELD